MRDRRLPWYLPAGGSNPFGAMAYVEAALEIAATGRRRPASRAGHRRHRGRVRRHRGGPGPGAAAGRTADPRVLGVVVNDAFPLDAPVIADLANRTADLLRERGARLDAAPLEPGNVTMRTDWLGETYGDPTPASMRGGRRAAERDELHLEPVYTGKSLAAMRDVGGTPEMPEPILWLNTHGPR